MKTTAIKFNDVMADRQIHIKIQGITAAKIRIKIFVFLLNIIKRILPLKTKVETDFK